MRVVFSLFLLLVWQISTVYTDESTESPISSTTAASEEEVAKALQEILEIDNGEKVNATGYEGETAENIHEMIVDGDIVLNRRQAEVLLRGGRGESEGEEENNGENQGQDKQENDASPWEGHYVGAEHTEKPVIRAKRGYQTDRRYWWNPSQPIPYFFDRSLPASYIQLIRQGLAFWQNNTCLSFVENPNGQSALRFFVGNGCYSSLGRQGKRWQDVSIGNGCNYFGTVTHEIAHAIGFFHTMSRPDRDDYIYINGNNIDPQQKFNFMKVLLNRVRQMIDERVIKNAPGTDESFGVKFDYGSVMQYGQYAFALNAQLPTIIARDKWMQNTMGQREGPAFSDVKTVNKAFQCDAKCGPNKCKNGGFMHPRDCSRCVCPRSFGGPTCTDLPKGSAPVCNGETVEATSSWKQINASVGYEDYETRPLGDCFWMVKAPPGKKVVLRLKQAPSSCVQGCLWQGLEINLGNFEGYGTILCCSSLEGQQWYSVDNMASIRGFARSHLSQFIMEYVAV